MGLLANLLRPRAATPDPADDFWYRPVGQATAAGVRVTPDIALTSATVWACNRVLSETIAALPLLMYRQMSQDQRREEPNHPIASLLKTQPNGWQTALEFRQYLTSCAVMHGNGYARLRPGPRGPVDRLEPLDPDLVTPERIGGGLRYRLRGADGREEMLTDDEVFHLRGLTLDGVTGVSVIAYARESIGVSLAAEGYGARVFSQDARPGGVLEHPGKLSPEATQRLKADWQAMHSGPGGAHKTAVLSEGMTWRAMGMTSEDAQYLQTREFEVAEIARWFGVPLHMIGETSKSTSWGSGIEQLSIGFVTFTLLPWLKRWEQAIARDLLIAPEVYSAEHVVAGLLRGDTKSRYEAHAIGRQWGWLSINDVRRLENMNPVADGDTYLQPVNMAPAGQPTAPGGPRTPAPANGHAGPLLGMTTRGLEDES